MRGRLYFPIIELGQEARPVPAELEPLAARNLCRVPIRERAPHAWRLRRPISIPVDSNDASADSPTAQEVVIPGCHCNRPRKMQNVAGNYPSGVSRSLSDH